MSLFNDLASYLWDENPTVAPNIFKHEAVKRFLFHTNRYFLDALSSQNISDTLKHNLFYFSGFRTFRQLQELSYILQDADFSNKDEFLKRVQKLGYTYNKVWLQTEADYAIACSLMAAKWNDFYKNKDDYFLQYRTANDEKVRYSHQLLNRTTLPMDDPFWEEYYPPLGWNCRCNVVQVLKGSSEISDSDKARRQGFLATSQRSADKIFRYNPGKQQILFPSSHPYYKVENRNTIALCIADTQIDEYVQSIKDNYKFSSSALQTKTLALPLYAANWYKGEVNSFEKKMLFITIAKDVDKLKYIENSYEPLRTEADGKKPKNVAKKKKKKVVGFNKYEYIKDNKTYVIGMSVHYNNNEKWECPYYAYIKK